MKTFTIIAYKPSSSCSHMGCHMASYSSDFIYEHQLSEEELKERIAQLKATELDCCEDGYENINYFEDGAGTFDHLSPEFHDAIDERAAALRNAIIEKKQQADAAAKARAIAAQEAAERKQLQQLTAKYGEVKP